MISTILFCLICIAGAGIVILHRPGSRPPVENPAMVWPFVLAALVGLLFVAGKYEGYGQRLTLTVEEMRIPLATAKVDGTYFTAGPLAENSDLVVGPYANADQSDEVYRPELDGLLTIRRRGEIWELCARQVAPDVGANLPGMDVRFDGTLAPDRTCREISTRPVTALIERRDAPFGPERPRSLFDRLREIISIHPIRDDSRGLQKRRHLIVARMPDFISIRPPRDEKIARYLGRCTNRQSAGHPEQTALRLAPAAPDQTDLGVRIPRNLVFDQLGRGGAHPLLDPMRLGVIGDEQTLCTAPARLLAWPEEASAARLMIRSRTTRLDWWIVGLVFVSAFLTVRSAKARWAEPEGRPEASVVLALQWLLTLRLIFAMAGLENDPNLVQSDILWPPALALVCVPLIAIALLRGDRPERDRELLPLIAQIPVTALLIAWGLRWQTPDGQSIGLVVLTLALLAWRWAGRQPHPLLVSAFAWMRRLIARAGQGLATLALRIARKVGRGGTATLETWRTIAVQAAAPDDVKPDDGAARRTGPADTDLWHAGVALATLIFLARAALSIVGRVAYHPARWQERFDGIPLIHNIPLSLVYAPLAIVAMALMITGYRKFPSVWRALLLGGAFGGLFIGIAALARDFGTIWIFGWPVAWGIASLAALRPASPGIGGWLARLALLGPLASPVLLAGGFYALYANDVPSPQADLTAHLEAAAHWDRNLVRLQRFVDPGKLVDIGNTWAFEMLEQAAQLEPITANTIGHGFLAPSGIVQPLLGYQYSDNLLAAQVVWPFGRIGLAALLAALLAVVLSLWRSTDTGQRDWRDEASRLAAMTFFWSGAYMALANLDLVPFTGRNFYLLAARSMGDLAEGFALLLLIALPYAAAMGTGRTRNDDGDPK